MRPTQIALRRIRKGHRESVPAFQRIGIIFTRGGQDRVFYRRTSFFGELDDRLRDNPLGALEQPRLSMGLARFQPVAEFIGKVCPDRIPHLSCAWPLVGLGGRLCGCYAIHQRAGAITVLY